MTNGDRIVWLLPLDAMPALALSLEDGWVSPRYGVKAATHVIVWKGTAAVPFEAAFLFTDRRLTPAERAAARATLS